MNTVDLNREYALVINTCTISHVLVVQLCLLYGNTCSTIYAETYDACLDIEILFNREFLVCTGNSF